VTIRLTSVFITCIFGATTVLAQPPARPAPQPPLPLFLKETWKDTPAVPVTQDVVTNPDLVLTLYGKAPEVNNEGGTPHVWTGLCITEFYLAEVHWLLLDAETLTTKGNLLPTVDLGKVDEIGFVDLTPGSGHGLGGFSDLGWIEVYGKPVARN
jgi:hypothetical protein